jgi:hypothetical protein
MLLNCHGGIFNLYADVCCRRTSRLCLLSIRNTCPVLGFGLLKKLLLRYSKQYCVVPWDLISVTLGHTQDVVLKFDSAFEDCHVFASTIHALRHRKWIHISTSLTLYSASSHLKVSALWPTWAPLLCTRDTISRKCSPSKWPSRQSPRLFLLIPGKRLLLYLDRILFRVSDRTTTTP